MYEKYKSGTLDEDIKLFLEGLPPAGKSIFEMSPAEVRKANEVFDSISINDVCKISQINIDKTDHNIPLRLYEPLDQQAQCIIIYIHGGGWVFGSLPEADHICSAFANRIPAIVISPGYRLSPEVKFPGAINDIYDVYQWVLQNKKGELKLFVCGESAGATMATVLCQMARDRQELFINYQLLLCPTTNLSNMDTESYAFFGGERWLSRTSMTYYRAQYLNREEEALSPLVSPLLLKDARGLPPALIVTAEFDVLHDEGQQYAELLKNAGVETEYKMYPGTIHSFFIFNKIFGKANLAIEDCIQKFKERVKG